MAHHRTTCEPGRTSPYHVDIRLRMLWQRSAQQKTLRQIACNFCVSAGTVSNIVMLYETTGSLSPRKPVKSSFFSHRHNDSLWHPLHTKEGDEISMFCGPCLQSSISTLSFSFLALFFCYAVSSCVLCHNHPYLVSERLFLAENKAFPYLRRALAHPRRALAIL